MKGFGLPAVIVFSCLLCPLLIAETDKVTAEDVISKSLAAIASPQDRAAVKYFELTGTVKINTNIGLETAGTALLTSEGNKVKFALKTPSKLYSSDQFVFDGKDVKVTKAPDGRRSPLADFMWWQGALLRDGLLGGVLSTAWPFYGDKLRNNAKLNYEGLKQVDGMNVQVLSYSSKNVESTTKVKLMFDAATGRHIRTIYDLEISVDAAGRPVRPGSLALDAAGRPVRTGSVDVDYRPAHYTLEETFSDFRQLGSYMLPLHDRLSLITDTGSGNWFIDVSYNSLNGTDLSPVLR